MAQHVNGIVYLVDAAEPIPDRMIESKEALDELLGLEELNKIPFLILGNKIDDPKARSEPQLREELGIFQTTGKGKSPVMEGVRPIEVYPNPLSLVVGL
ncbi:MAG: hypothetical protein Q9159_003700 [Coniocarpon cinnabarinum]